MSYLQKSAAKKKKKNQAPDDSVVKMQEVLHAKVNPASSNMMAAPKPTFGRRSGTR